MFKSFTFPDVSVENKSRSDFGLVYKKGTDALKLVQQAGSPQGVLVRGYNASDFMLTRWIGQTAGAKGDIVIMRTDIHGDFTSEVVDGTSTDFFGLQAGVLMTDVAAVPNSVNPDDESYEFLYVYIQLSGVFENVNMAIGTTPLTMLTVSTTVPGQVEAAGAGDIIVGGLVANVSAATTTPLAEGFSADKIYFTHAAATSPVSWASITGKPAFIGAGATAADARTAIGAGTSDLVLGTTAGTALEGNGVAAEAIKLQTPRAISVSGAVIGTINFDGSAPAPIVTTATPATTTVFGAVKKGVAVPDAVAAPTMAEFNALLASLRTAEVITT